MPPVGDEKATAAVDPQEPLRVTVLVRARSPLDKEEVAALGAPPASERQYPSREVYAASHGADPADLAAVEAFASRHGLRVVESSVPRRSVVLTGPAGSIASAFGVGLRRDAADPGSPHFPSGPVQLPPELAPIVETVLGLDDRPHAHPHDAGGA